MDAALGVKGQRGDPLTIHRQLAEGVQGKCNLKKTISRRGTQRTLRRAADWHSAAAGLRPAVRARVEIGNTSAT
jgi:hypothetical protein